MSAPKPALNLKFGLNVNPRKAAAAASAAPRKPIFDADELEHDDEPQNSAKADRARVNASLKAAQSLSAKRAEEEAKKVLEEDPSVFDYDGVYDSIKGDEKKKKKEAEKKPKYIESLLASASERKAEQLRVQERKIQREREEEKELYGEIDKEKFVTEAYKKALEEQRKVEEEEKRKEALEDVTKKKDMTDFYRNVLDATARTVPLPGSQPSKPSTAPSDEPQQQREEKPAAMKAGVKMNDSEEIVDKRDLLSAGLNVIGKPAVVQRKAEAYRPARYVETNKKLSREEETRRALEMVEAQRREREEEERKEQEEERRKLAESLAKQNTEDTVSEAKRRYLERKRKREEEAKEA